GPIDISQVELVHAQTFVAAARRRALRGTWPQARHPHLVAAGRQVGRQSLQKHLSAAMAARSKERVDVQDFHRESFALITKLGHSAGCVQTPTSFLASSHKLTLWAMMIIEDVIARPRIPNSIAAHVPSATSANALSRLTANEPT